jgi:cytochrome c-type biogenesis protein
MLATVTTLAAAGHADTTVLAAFAVGFVSFVSPCVLPLVPGYLSAVSGVSLADIRTREQGLARVLAPAIVFCLSFTVMFVALGMTATGLGSTLRDHQDLLNKLAGSLIVAMGVFFLLTPFVPKLNREWRPEQLMARAGSGGPVIAGLAFAVAWTPCVGPTLASILAAASTSDTVGHGGVLLACYSLGLAVPFLLTAIAFDRATTAFRWIRDHYVVVTAISGIILVVMGTMILSGELTRLNQHAQELLGHLHLDFIYNL